MILILFSDEVVLERYRKLILCKKKNWIGKFQMFMVLICPDTYKRAPVFDMSFEYLTRILT